MQIRSTVMHYLKSRELKEIEGREFTLRIPEISQDSVRFTDETQVSMRRRMVSARIGGLLWERLIESVAGGHKGPARGLDPGCFAPVNLSLPT